MHAVRLNELIDALRQTDSVEAIHRVGCDICTACEFEHFIYGASVPTSLVNPQVIIISGYPETWRQHYLEQGFQQHDPTVHHCARNVTPLIWTDLPLEGLSPAAGRVMREARDFQLNSGVSCPVQSAGGEFGMLSVARAAEVAGRRDRIVAELPALHLLTAHFHEALRRVVRIVEIPPNLSLSSREKECLLWSSEGKTAWEVSQILGISERTVTFHLQNAADKLQVVNRQHAVARAISFGLISPHQA